LTKEAKKENGLKGIKKVAQLIKVSVLILPLFAKLKLPA
jgi:hypothetical protein